MKNIRLAIAKLLAPIRIEVVNIPTEIKQPEVLTIKAETPG